MITKKPSPPPPLPPPLLLSHRRLLLLLLPPALQLKLPLPVLLTLPLPTPTKLLLLLRLARTAGSSYGITRWPFRKLKSIQRTLAKDDPNGCGVSNEVVMATATAMNPGMAQMEGSAAGGTRIAIAPAPIPIKGDVPTS